MSSARWRRRAVEPGMLLVIQPHLVSEDGKRGVQVGNLVVCDGGGARSLQRTPMRFFETAEPMLG